MENTKIEHNALNKLSYGLFVLTAKNDQKDNGCIINTAIQVTTQPNCLVMALNKLNYTHNMIKESGEFNVSILSEEVDFSIFKRFGFQGGSVVDKFEGFKNIAKSENGLLYITGCTNAFLSCKVIAMADLGTHTLFTAEITEAKVLSKIPSITYSYYFANVKPKPVEQKEAATSAEKKVVYVCSVCGYVYEGDPLPADFVCPVCKHTAEVFERVVR